MSSKDSEYGEYGDDDDYYYYYYDPGEESYEEIDQNRIYSTRGSKARNSHAEKNTIRNSRGGSSGRASQMHGREGRPSRNSRSGRNSRHNPHYDNVYGGKLRVLKICENQGSGGGKSPNFSFGEGNP